MSDQLRLCLVGATGLIGRTLIEQAISRPEFRIVGVSRREMDLPHGARMEMLLADPAGWPDAIAAAQARVLVCALGTTWKKAGKDEAAFRAVDRDLVVACGKAAKDAGIERMIVVSSVGSDPTSRSFYLRVKSEMEGDLSRLRFKRLDILRPGMLRGPRIDDSRPLEAVGQVLAPVADLLMHGKYRQYRSLRAETVAQAIFAYARARPAGHFIHDWDSIRRASG